MSTVDPCRQEKLRRLCVFLMQMGGPETTAEIEPFLTSLLSDVLPAPQWIRPTLARLIARRRAKKVEPTYRELGGSPLRRNTVAQACALEAALTERGFEAKVLVTNRYTAPRVDEVLALARRDWSNATWVALPLYPQYSFSTSKTSIDELTKSLTVPEQTCLVTVAGYPTDDGYLSAQADCVREALSRFVGEERATVHVLFSAHGLPVSFVQQGDPYPTHVQQTVAGVMARLGSPPPHHISFQSRMGPMRWLKPSTIETVRRLAASGVKHLLVVPVSFVSDHIETLYELDIQLKAVAGKVGIIHFERAPVPGTRPSFIDALAGIVVRTLPRDSVPYSVVT